ncbi:uncharacterized protein A4U43_C08F7100 [Asparagus officinalis]|uniref:uncharacterized protein LOC109819531 n=1 Tax=Asparagus officinalis TaxID=4686 RepID=UPI00098DEBE2|nr:uncharacterized protein LOC109819531 [Asparagus officinalis]XP_020240872.1 uncharacterized protein LOC109819531 [Asparagus officinalis]XP_020240873.1 uncharacterized protein LOC109819531 [Asparagus officinalis]ONK59503.1 uncharacterized protein A4U43_C08F7100 [Asparagus officinalis]
MPKERRTRSVSFEARSHASPYPCCSSSSHHHGSSSSSRNSPESPVAATKDTKQWDEVRCPVCMEFPHNAVLLDCSSGDKGCQPFMCDTSYRHSNCLDQYKKAFSGSSSEKDVNNQEPSKLSCPLCRGKVTGWGVVEAARRYMNSKVRSCSKESCEFTGSYNELRKHARNDHPLTRPTEADPERQRDWRRMEQRMDLGDLFSTMQSAMSVEDGGLGGLLEDDEEVGLRSIFHVSSMAVLLIFRVSSAGGSGWTSTRSSVRRRRGRGTLWGETYNEPMIDDMDSNENENGNGNEDEGDDEIARGSDEVTAAPRRGRRRRRHRMMVSDDEVGDDDGDDDGDLP